MAFPRTVPYADGVDSLGASTFNDLEARAAAVLERTTNRDVANGYPSLDAGGLLRTARMPARLALGLTDLGSVTTTATLDMAGSIARSFTCVLIAPLCVVSVINAVAGSEATIVPFQDGSPPRMIQHPGVTVWTSTGPPTLSSNANAPDRFSYLVLAVDGSGNPTKIVGSLGFTSGVAPAPIDKPIVT